ncbi:hypothetical protein A8H31_13000 [Burkholderia thailandensis]|nr:hypothetical protein WJ27_23440 [Burkholderia thailandensis]AVR08503.1 hypothetical protein A8H31_13000 [Burkholderia thailandensis]KVG11731.1 hypothetical protein WJ25_08515 [Burkholderia thailandensis]KVG15029.1 hypothetical protein WJ28_15230 [Burkholderia thailandensis]NOK44504.1 hypothetical protein [Burkholderia thailandensis]
MPRRFGHFVHFGDLAAKRATHSIGRVVRHACASRKSTTNDLAGASARRIAGPRRWLRPRPRGRSGNAARAAGAVAR